MMRSCYVLSPVCAAAGALRRSREANTDDCSTTELPVGKGSEKVNKKQKQVQEDRSALATFGDRQTDRRGREIC